MKNARVRITLRSGRQLEAPPKMAAALVRLGRASYPVEPAPAPAPPPAPEPAAEPEEKPKRRYRRRDLEAED